MTMMMSQPFLRSGPLKPRPSSPPTESPQKLYLYTAPSTLLTRRTNENDEEATTVRPVVVVFYDDDEEQEATTQPER